MRVFVSPPWSRPPSSAPSCGARRRLMSPLAFEAPTHYSGHLILAAKTLPTPNPRPPERLSPLLATAHILAPRHTVPVPLYLCATPRRTPLLLRTSIAYVASDILVRLVMGRRIVFVLVCLIIAFVARRSHPSMLVALCTW